MANDMSTVYERYREPIVPLCTDGLYGSRGDTRVDGEHFVETAHACEASVAESGIARVRIKDRSAAHDVVSNDQGSWTREA